MPEWFKTYLLGLAPAEKDELWLYFDCGDTFDMIECVGRMDGRPNVGNEAVPDLPIEIPLYKE